MPKSNHTGSNAPTVAIIGAGTGGLCLAHALRVHGLDFKVFERDLSPTDRLQGYRLNISATGNRALQACLPAAQFDRFVAAAAQSSSAVTFLDHALRRLLVINIPPVDRAAPESERPISRIALRRVLLDGVEDAVAFGKTFVAYERDADGGVTAQFADGSTAKCGLLVGADGASSRVARQLLPRAGRQDTGLVAITGRFALDAAACRDTPAPIFAGPTLVMGPDGRFMFASAVRYPPGADNRYDRDEYAMWGFSARREVFGFRQPLDQLPAELARATVLQQMPRWHEALRGMVARADAETLTTFAVKSAIPVAPWKTGNVTLLGDALHNMTPYRGMGANAALRDAQALAEALLSVQRGQCELASALAAYEREMIDLGFAAVRASLADMRRLHARSALRRLATKTTLRLVDVMPGMQHRFRGRR